MFIRLMEMVVLVLGFEVYAVTISCRNKYFDVGLIT